MADGSGETRSSWIVGIGSGRRDPDDFSPMKCLQLHGCYPQFGVNGFDWRDVRQRGGGREESPANASFVGVAVRAAAASLPNPCLNSSPRVGWDSADRSLADLIQSALRDGHAVVQLAACRFGSSRADCTCFAVAAVVRDESLALAPGTSAS